MTDVVVAERLNQGSEVRQGEQLHVAFLQHERDLELLDADLDLLTDCSGGSSATVEIIDAVWYVSLTGL
jgi:hypothetical protein